MTNLLNRTTWTVKLKKALETNIKTVLTSYLYANQGSLAYTTDGKRIYVADGTSFSKITDAHYPDIIFNLDQVVSNNDQIVWL